MNWKFLAVALAGALLVLSGCASSRVDPPARAKASGESAELAALRRDNDALRQDQTQSQRQIEQLSKQLAAEREEQRRFREMMSTNFDLLEQSVSMTLAKSVDKGGKGPTPPDSAAPAKAVPVPGVDNGNRTSANGSAAPRPVPPASAPSQTAAIAGPAGHDAKAHGAKAPAQKPWSAAHAGSASAPASAAGKQDTSAALTVAGAKPAAAQPALLQANDDKPYDDPDLAEPANPRQLSSNRAAKQLYDKGFGLFDTRQYEQSILVYQNFLNRYPNDIYSDNAQFWIGEAYLRMDKLDEAETAYRKVLREYAHKSTIEGYKTPDSIYRLGQIYGKRNNAKLARYYLSQVARRFPDSSAGRRASRELGEEPSLTSQTAETFANGG